MQQPGQRSGQPWNQSANRLPGPSASVHGTIWATCIVSSGIRFLKAQAVRPWAFLWSVHYSRAAGDPHDPGVPSSRSIAMSRSRKSWMTAALVVRCRVTSETWYSDSPSRHASGSSS